MTKDELLAILSTLPESPGCYLYFDSKGEVIYVGKAVNLRRRVSSYFYKEVKDMKTRRLVESICDLKYFVVSTESEALVLENNLIKSYNPKYNILLKDGSSYPYIIVTKESFPRILLSRDKNEKAQIAFGPFTDVRRARKILRLLRELFFIRTCTLPLTPSKIEERRFRPCLQYHIKKCKAPCVGKVSSWEYNQAVGDIREILSGNISQILKGEEEKMMQAAEKFLFEDAAVHKAKLDLLSTYRDRQSLAIPLKGRYVVFAPVESNDAVFVCMLQVSDGLVLRFVTDVWKKVLDEELDELFPSIVTDMLSIYPFPCDEVLLSIPMTWGVNEKEGLSFVIPERGAKKELVELARKNAEQYRADRMSRMERLNPDQYTTKLMSRMKEDLSLDRLPRHIECFDNSNIQGTNPVAACVVFRNGKPSRREYRKFHVKTVVGADDFKSMREIVTRRYQRLLDEKMELPDLIVIDGGKGQLRMACDALASLGLDGEMPILGLAERLEEIYFPGVSESLYLKRNSETLNVLRAIRDEAHRFGITFHRSLRSKAQIKSELDEIPGVGMKTKEKLLKTFESLEKVKQASIEEIRACIGNKKGEEVYRFLHTKEILKGLLS